MEYFEGEPAATSELFLGGGVAGVTWTAANEARREGVTTAVLQASESGQGVYFRLGFRACCQFCEYAPA
ncbi:MAG: hypothetical protein EXQ52_18200 [Bryobacterales bacterium]|nr:hypothetical protein [Bryobacterales bacterium]